MSSQEQVIIRYVTPQPSTYEGYKAPKQRFRPSIKIKPGTETQVVIRTEYEEPFVSAVVRCTDSKAQVVIHDIVKGLVTLVVTGSKPCDAQLYVEVSEMFTGSTAGCADPTT